MPAADIPGPAPEQANSTPADNELAAAGAAMPAAAPAHGSVPAEHDTPPTSQEQLQAQLCQALTPLLVVPPPPQPRMPADTVESRLLAYLAPRLSKQALDGFFDVWRQAGYEAWVPKVQTGQDARALVCEKVMTSSWPACLPPARMLAPAGCLVRPLTCLLQQLMQCCQL